jgi:hypothetical protein
MSEALAEAEAPAAESAAVGTAPEAAGTAEAVEAPAAAPAFDYEDPRFLDLVDNRAAELASGLLEQRLGPLEQLLQQAFAGDQNAQQQVDQITGDLNPWDDNFASSLDQRFQSLEQKIGGMIDQVTAPLQAREQQEIVQEGEQRLQDIMADDIARHGDFPVDPETGKSAAKELVRPLADILFPEIAARYGNNPRAAEIAISKASGLLRAVGAEYGKAALAEHVNRNAKLAGVQGEPGIGAVGVETTPDQIYRPGQLTDKYAANASRLRS